LKELDQVLEMPPEALEQLQQGILNDLQSTPEVEILEEIQPPPKKANEKPVDAEASSSKVEPEALNKVASNIKIKSKVKVTRFVINAKSANE
jgi:hypothetical protein